MTWNRSEEEFLPFLDILLSNQNGLLYTSIYHKSSSESYVTSFVSDNPRRGFGNIIQGPLSRAIRYSSTYPAFDNERSYIKMMLLYNGLVIVLLMILFACDSKNIFK